MEVWDSFERFIWSPSKLGVHYPGHLSRRRTRNEDKACSADQDTLPSRQRRTRMKQGHCNPTTLQNCLRSNLFHQIFMVIEGPPKTVVNGIAVEITLPADFAQVQQTTQWLHVVAVPLCEMKEFEEVPSFQAALEFNGGRYRVSLVHLYPYHRAEDGYSFPQSGVNIRVSEDERTATAVPSPANRNP